MNSLTVAVGQFAPSADIGANRDAIAGLTSEAALAGVGLLVLPEESMVAADEVDRGLDAVAREHWPGFVDFLCERAREHGIALVAAGYEAAEGQRPFNTVLAIDATGEVAGRYRKLHLYDAYSYRESDRVAPGDGDPVVARIAGKRVGLINCYDIRFPELARSLIDQGAEILTVSAAWAVGPMKEDHWRTLTRARAIENTSWLLAAGSASADCIGQSMVIDPAGVVRAALGGERYGLAVCELSQRRTDEVRAVLPVLENRRLVGRLGVWEQAGMNAR